MKLRTQLLLANALSIVIIFVFLIISYMRMFLSNDAVIVLSFVTIGAGVVSFIAHSFFIRPIEKSVQFISSESKKVAKGNFDGKVPSSGPLEFQQLAENFNEMSKQLNDSFTKIKKSEASRRELIANISHDLRTPLSSIQSFVEALQDDVIQDEASFERYLATIQLETKQLSELINDLFQLSELDAGSETYHPHPYHVDSLIVETLQNLLLQLEENRTEVNVVIPEKLPAAAVMPEKIKRVLINLIQNAVRYSPRGSVIQLKADESSREWIKISISDQGEGISESEYSQIFDRFYRVEKSRSKEKGGSGLGLAIAKSIVELHGGQIGVHSREGGGSTFWFTIPTWKAREEDVEQT
ncbi:HAMP domain-containing sensor histidine kinase [Bacillus taeanensis]|uniref:histidine kinase n=1 Tax=Bacillus taeanensis TaxID=273032 RepID=A0A366XYQ3_9BACI|nr:HAMP domain-containing sensor histidine kinase [Bacillus taeanensis]RBW70698.1 two-component sensor histidine kinase [Bacillus taeanensis]